MARTRTGDLPIEPWWSRFDVPPGPGQAVCSRPACGRGLFWIKSARKPGSCFWHQKNGGPRIDRADYVPLEVDPSARTLSERATQTRHKRAEAVRDHLAEMRAAVWFGLLQDEDKAAELALAGREPDLEQLPELAEAAKKSELESARTGKSTFTAQLLQRGLALSAIAFLEEIPLLKPENRAYSLRLAQQTLEALGGGKLIYSNVELDLGGLSAPVSDEGPSSGKA